jgi:hypothetical protein|tara:strand:- start:417 stop:1580 length:1164 start_codon:yes stop_codon:yes gene_type:complete
MNVGQMHIAISQGVDKINSLQADMLLPQEIDIELNKSQIRFINTKYGSNNTYRQGFEQSQKRIDDLRSLVREYTAPTTYKEQYNNTTWVDKFQLPTDYMYLVNQRSEIMINNCSRLTWSFANTDPVAYIVVPFSNLHDGTNFINNLELVADPSNGTLGQVGMLPGIAWNTYTYPADVVTLQNDIVLSANWGAGFDFYWEEYGNINVPNSFIVLVDTLVHTFYNWDSSITNVNSGSNLITTALGSFVTSTGLQDSENTLAYGEFTGDALGTKRIVDNANREYALNKFVQQDDIAKLLGDPFNTTKYTSPLTTIRGRFIDIYTSDIFIIDKLKITYIRQPSEISLPLGISCELPIHCHQEIVDMAVSSILEGISDPRYKVHQNEVGKNE